MCILRLGVADLQLDPFLQTLNWAHVTAVSRSGDPKFASRPYGPREAKSSVNIEFSDADSADLAGQIRDALRFTTEQNQNLRAARNFPGIEQLCFDFAVYARDVAAQYERFPASLLLSLGELNIDLEISSYSIAEPGAKALKDQFVPAGGARA